MFNPTSYRTSPQSFLKGLACAAVNPSLRSILILNAPYQGLEVAANTLTQMLQAVDQSAERVHLGVSELDDDLWGSLELHKGRGNSPVTWHRGSLAGLWNESCTRLVLISDLTKVSLAVARACVMLMGTDTAHLERHGQHRQWQPNICWLAGCASNEIGGISPHILDRFALRLQWPDLFYADPVERVLRQVLTNEPFENMTTLFLSADLKEHIQNANKHWAAYTDKAQRRVFHYSSLSHTYLLRREIALARLAQTIARLEGASKVTEFHVDAAAQLIGLASTFPQTVSSTSPGITTPDSSLKKEVNKAQREKPTGHTEAATIQPETIQSTVPVYSPDTAKVLDSTRLPIEPYPEDGAPIERETASLRHPFAHYTAASISRGSVIGIEQATSFRDIAVVSTVFAAAPFQFIRHKHRQSSLSFWFLHLQSLFRPTQRQYLQEEQQRFLLSQSDLRSYRRAPATERLLLLLLDYTCLRECNWQEALLPYLRSAYADRASISIIQVGAATVANELRADVVSARSILVPHIGTALEAKRGKATPLAHGFDLALRTLRHALQHGRSTVQKALFIVMSDGRGNIPLEVSRTGHVDEPIHRQGIEDALQIAKLIPDIKGVQTIFLNPQPQHHSDLPLTLANALKAEVKNIPRRSG